MRGGGDAKTCQTNNATSQKAKRLVVRYFSFLGARDGTRALGLARGCTHAHPDLPRPRPPRLRPPPAPTRTRPPPMSRDGVGVLSLSLEFLHLRRWPKDVPIHGSRPTCHVAVNFDTLAALESNFVELPDATVSQRDFAGRAQLWHGLQLRSLHDILHLEVRDERGNAPRDPHTGAAPILASLSVPVTAFLEEAFMQSDAGGAPREFILDGPPDLSGGAGLCVAQFRVKFHLQRDVLAALARGVGLDVASVESIAAYAPETKATLCAADTLAATKLERDAAAAAAAVADAGAIERKKTSFNSKAVRLEREERDAFRRAADDAHDPSGVASYASMTAGIKRFLTGQSARRNKTVRGNLVELLSDCRR